MACNFIYKSIVWKLRMSIVEKRKKEKKNVTFDCAQVEKKAIKSGF